MPRLPQPGADSGTWGDILNDFLTQAHKADGSLKDNSVSLTAIPDTTITEAKLATAVQAKLNQAGATGPAGATGSSGATGATGPAGSTTIAGISGLQAALDSKATPLVDRGDFVPSTMYTQGDVVTYQYARWYRKTTGSGGASFTAAEWIHLGLYAIGTTSDPGGGMLWIDVS